MAVVDLEAGLISFDTSCCSSAYPCFTVCGTVDGRRSPPTDLDPPVREPFSLFHCVHLSSSSAVLRIVGYNFSFEYFLCCDDRPVHVKHTVFVHHDAFRYRIDWCFVVANFFGYEPDTEHNV